MDEKAVTLNDLSSNDIALLRSGIIVGTSASLTIPSGITVSGKTWARLVRDFEEH